MKHNPRRVAAVLLGTLACGSGNGTPAEPVAQGADARAAETAPADDAGTDYEEEATSSGELALLLGTGSTDPTVFEGTSSSVTSLQEALAGLADAGTPSTDGTTDDPDAAGAPPTDDPGPSLPALGPLLPAGGAGHLDGTALRAAVRGLRESTARCFAAALERDPEFTCVAEFRVSVTVEGRVTVAGEVAPNGCPRRLVSCLTGVLEGLDFTATPPTGGAVQLRAPVRIEPLP